jgi:hypothetical protein
MPLISMAHAYRVTIHNLVNGALSQDVRSGYLVSVAALRYHVLRKKKTISQFFLLSKPYAKFFLACFVPLLY